MGWTERVDSMLQARGRRAIKCTGLTAFFVAVAIDAAAVVLLREAPALVEELKDEPLVDPPLWTPAALLAGLPDLSHDTVDVLVLFVVRVLVLLFLGWLAVKVGTPDLSKLTVAPASDAAAPLLINAADAAAGGAICLPCDGSAAAAAAAAAPTSPVRPSTEIKSEHLKSSALKKAAEWKKNLVIAAIFSVSTVGQVYVGVKCISFQGHWAENGAIETAQGILFGLVVVFINIESWLMKRLINALTAEEGFFVPELHPHTLTLQDTLLHQCDLCRQRTKQAYRCALCDFDVCPACFNKKDKSAGEGQLRGDKGVRNVETIGAGAYFARGLKLVAPHLPLFGVALLCLCANSLINLFMPNFQGRIIDAVIAGHTACATNATAAHGSAECDGKTAAFLDVVTWYLILSVTTGALGGLRSLCFNLVGRRIMVWVRSRLYRAIIVQDIAFFDGIRTGDLTQRLSGDTRAMVSPIQYVLSTLLSNIILLVGGVVMCFVTSWRLSMVAYTTVLPVMHVTETYARWSSKINREIYQHYSDANSLATEAITNVRTVRGVSSEPYEVDRYEVAMADALRKGVKDAIFGSVASAFNNYLDLGAGVLLLWYGGSIAMSPSGAITVGSLIQYQLYWNMINSAYQALNNVLNSFTRAAGAAERVLSLVDMEPDIGSGSGMGAIDPVGGAPVDVAVRRWDIAFEDVHFRYQARRAATAITTTTSTSTSTSTTIPLPLPDAPDQRRPRRYRLLCRRGLGVRARRQVGRRQVDARPPPPALLRPAGGADLAGRRRLPRPQPRVAPQADRGGVAGDATLQRDDPREHRVRSAAAHRRRARRGDARRVRLRVHRLVRGRPPHARRRARPAALRRPEAADRDRALPVAQAEAAAPRRGDVRARRRVGSSGPKSA